MRTLIDDVAAFAIERFNRTVGAEEQQVLLELVTDAITCELAGRSGDAYASARRFVELDGTSSTPSGEALCAGVAVRDLDLLDVFVGRDVCHPAENVPVALRWAAGNASSGQRLLEAIASGYEAQCRFAEVVDVRRGGLHHVTAASLSVPVMALHLGLITPDRLADALALAIARAPTLRSIARGHVSAAKAFAFPLAARSAMEAVHLAASGVTGPARALDDLVEMVGADVEEVRTVFSSAVGASPRLARMKVKRFPVQFSLQAVAHAGIALNEALDGRSTSVHGLRVEAGSRLLDNTVDATKRVPSNRETADHSLFAVLGIALVEGRLGAEEMMGSAWLVPETQRLMDLIDVGPFEEPPAGGDHDGMLVRVTATLDGQDPYSVAVTPDEGFVRIGEDGSGVRQKLAGALHDAPPGRIAALLSGIDGLPGVEDVTGLLSVLDQ